MKCWMDGRERHSKHGTYVFFATLPTLPSRHQLPLHTYIYIPALLSVSTSQYPIRPIRKYSRGVICRGRRYPIGRHRFFRRRAPRASTVVVARAAPLRAGDTSIPQAGQLYCRVWSDIILSPADRIRVTTPPPSFFTLTHTHTLIKSYKHKRRI